MFIFNFIFGIAIIVGGVYFIKYNYQVVNAFGRNNVFERKLGAGSSYPVFKIFGLLIILLGVLFTFSIQDEVFEFLLSPLINALSLN